MSAALVLSLWPAPTLAETVASLQIDAGATTYQAKVDRVPAGGYRVMIDCVAPCHRPVRYREAVGDSPVGLFVRDTDDLLYSIWSGGSAYRIRVWAMTDHAVRPVAVLSSRGWPEFLSDGQGRPVIRTVDGDKGGNPRPKSVWTYMRGRFTRTP